MLILDKDANTRATIRVHQGGCVVYEGSERDQESRVLCTVREWAGMFIVYSGRHDDNSTVQGRVIPNLDYSKFTVYEGESDTVLGLVPGYYEGGSQNKLCIDGWSGKILLWVGKISHSFFVGL